MEFLKTILIILLVYFALRFLAKLLWPYLVKYMTKKAGQKFEQMFNHSPFQQQKQNPEGSITIDKEPARKKSTNQSVGEYVDYEELD